MRRFRQLIVVLVFLIVSGSCVQKRDTKLVADYVFTNKMGVPLQLEVYPSMQDYGAKTDLLYSYQLAAGASVTLPLDVAHQYGIDWYSDDYRYTNWVLLPFTPGAARPNVQTIPSLTTNEYGGHLNLLVDRTDTSRSVLLNNSGISSTWKVQIDDSSSLQGTHSFILTKDFKCLYTYVGDTTVNRQFTFGVVSAYPPSFYVSVGDANGWYATLNFGEATSMTPMNRDTLALLFRDDRQSRFYQAVRQ